VFGGMAFISKFVCSKVIGATGSMTQGHDAISMFSL
jgi:hypothetical protein